MKLAETQLTWNTISKIFWIKEVRESSCETHQVLMNQAAQKAI